MRDLSKNEISALLLTLVGFSFHLVVVTFVGWFGSIAFFTTTDYSYSSLTIFSIVKDVAFVLCFLIAFIILFRCRVVVGNRLQTLLVSAPFSMTFIGSLLLILAGSTSLIISVGCAVLIGCGTASAFMTYQWIFSRDIYPQPFAATWEIVGGTALAALLYYSISWLGSTVVMVLLLAVFLPGAFLAVLLRLKNFTVGSPIVEDDINRTSAKKSLASLAIPALSIAIIGLVWGLLRAFAISQGMLVFTNNLGSFGRFFSAVILIAIFHFNKYHIRMDIFYRWALPLLGTGLILFPFLGVSYSAVLLSLSYLLFSVASMIAMLACNQVARFYRTSSLTVYCGSFCIIYLFQNVGVLGTQLLLINDRYLQTQPEQLLLTAIVIYILFMVFALSSRFERTTSIKVWNSEQIDALEEVNLARGRACLRLADACGLTAKEREVLRYLALGYGTSYIAKTMVISENTVHYHCKNIYSKLDVHNKQELFEKLEND